MWPVWNLVVIIVMNILPAAGMWMFVLMRWMELEYNMRTVSETNGDHIKVNPVTSINKQADDPWSWRRVCALARSSGSACCWYKSQAASSLSPTFSLLHQQIADSIAWL